MSARRLKLILLLGGILVSGMVLLTWTQNWFVVVLETGGDLSVPGDAAAPALAALALSGAALGAALAIAGRVFRVVLGILEVAIGALVIYSASTALVDPVLASAGSITASTGVSGEESVRALVESLAVTPWSVIALVAGVLLAAAGLLVVVTSSRWPSSSRKYQAVRLESADGEESSIGDWDSLSEGRDPT